MSALKTQDQGIIILSQQDYLPILVESFLIDRRSQGLSPATIDFYTKKLKYFLKYCGGQALTQVSQLTTDLIRRYVLELSETHNPGGVHACFQPLRSSLYWVEDEEIIFALQKLMGHSDLQVLRRYLAQTDEDIHTAHMRGSPVDNNL
jgi:site-specific recombinase XerD